MSSKSPEQLPGTALIVCTRNRPQELAGLIETLGKSSQIPETVVVVDSSFTENFELNREALNSLHGITVHHVTSSEGLPHQRNVGLQYVSQTTGAKQLEMIAFLDDDVRPNKDYFSQALRLLRSDDQLFCVGGFDTNLGSAKSNLLLRLALLGGRHPGQVLKSGIAVAGKINESFMIVDWVPGGMQCYKADVILKHKFDGRIRIHGEDVECQLRIARRTGLKVGTSSLLSVQHLSAVAGKSSLRASTKYLDGFRWELARTNPYKVKRLAVLYSTSILLIGSTVIASATLKQVRFQEALGHLDFLASLVLRRPILEFVNHDEATGPYGDF